MPIFTKPDGSTTRIPGVYSLILAIVGAASALPEFHVPMLIGDAPVGIPYDVATKKQADESLTWYTLATNKTAAERAWGAGSNLATAMKFAKRHGLPKTYAVVISPLTRASAIITSGTKAVNHITLYAKTFGAPLGYTKVKLTGAGALEITPIKHFAMLQANAASTDTRIYVDDNTWMTEGLVLTFGASGTNVFTGTVSATGTELSSSGQINNYVDLTAAIGTAITTSNYALCVVYDDAKVETATGLTTAGKVYDWIRDNSDVLGVKKEAGFTSATAPDAVSSATALKDITAWATVTAGTSPKATSTDHDALIGYLDAGYYQAFVQTTKLLPRAFCVLSSSSTIHGSWRDWAEAMFNDHNIATSITVGCAWGDMAIGAGNDTAPEYRAAALNSQLTMLCARGIDYVAAFLSTAPAVWALRVKGGVGHNLTWDTIQYSTLEGSWDEWVSGELTTLSTFGVTTIVEKLQGEIGVVVSQGLSTLQSNSQAWNSSDSTTCLVMQRDLADAIDAAMMQTFAEKNGTDAVDPTVLRVAAAARAKQLVDKGWILDGTFAITSIEEDSSGNGYNVDWTARPPRTVDFIGSTFSLVTGDE